MITYVPRVQGEQLTGSIESNTRMNAAHCETKGSTGMS